MADSDQTAAAQIGVIGLAVMGRNLARNFARHGHTVALHNRTQSRIDDAGRATSATKGRSSRPHVAGVRRLAWRSRAGSSIMVKAGDATDAVIDALVPLLEAGDIVVDGGNAHFEDTRRREAALREHGIHFVGTGISGGEEGALEGPSHHAGRLDGVVRVARPDARDDRRQGRRRAVLRLDGSRRRRSLRQDGPQRHRVRRHAVHRRGLRPAPGGRPEPARSAPTSSASGTRATSTRSSIEITAEVLDQVDAATGKPLVDVILDRGRAEGHRPLDRPDRPGARRAGPAIAEAVFARSASGAPPARDASPAGARRTERRVTVDDRRAARRRRPRTPCGRRRSSPTRRAWR